MMSRRKIGTAVLSTGRGWSFGKMGGRFPGRLGNNGCWESRNDSAMLPRAIKHKLAVSNSARLGGVRRHVHLRLASTLARSPSCSGSRYSMDSADATRPQNLNIAWEPGRSRSHFENDRHHA